MTAENVDIEQADATVSVNESGISPEKPKAPKKVLLIAGISVLVVGLASASWFMLSKKNSVAPVTAPTVAAVPVQHPAAVKAGPQSAVNPSALKGPAVAKPAGIKTAAAAPGKTGVKPLKSGAISKAPAAHIPASAPKPGVPAVASAPGMAGKPAAPKGAPVNLAAATQTTVDIKAVLPSAVKTVFDKSADGTKLSFLKFKFHPTEGRTILVKLPAQYKSVQLTKAGWISVFQAWGIDREMELQAEETQALNDASDDQVRAALGGSGSLPSASSITTGRPGIGGVQASSRASTETRKIAGGNKGPGGHPMAGMRGKH